MTQYGLNVILTFLVISDKRIKFGSRLWYLGRQIHTLSELNGGLSNNRLRVYNKQIRRRRDNKRVLITFAFARKNILPPE